MSEDGVTQRGKGKPGNHRDLHRRHDFSRLDPENGEPRMRSLVYQ